MPNKTELKSLLYKHLEYQRLVVEGCTYSTQNLASYAAWAEYSVVTTITPKYIRIVIPSKGNGLLIARCEDREINAGLWLICSDFGCDVDQYYWCRNRLTAKLREVVCMLTAEGPYLLHTIQI